MENKKKVQYRWQVLLLCIAVSISYPVLAKPSSASSTEKHNSRKPTNAKTKPATSATRSNSGSISTRSIPQRQQRMQTERKSRQTQTAMATSRKKVRSVGHAANKIQENNNLKKKLGVIPSDRIRPRYVTDLKETKRRTMVKTVIALPVPRTHARNQRGDEEKKSQRKSSLQTSPKLRLMVKKSQNLQIEVSQSGSASSAAVAATTLSLLSTPTTTVSPVQESSAPSNLPASSTQEGKQVPSVIPSPSPTATVASVERIPSVVMLKNEPQTNEWSGYTPQRAPFPVTFNSERLWRRINSVFVLPGDEIFLSVIDTQKRAEYTIRSSLGPERLLASRRWYWTAPADTGIYPVKITNTRTGSCVSLNVFVMIPLNRIQDGHLNGYRIGQYPTEALRQLPAYNPPRGLIEVTSENENIFVSPHFRLRQFICKQEGDYPKYMILDARLLATLEQLLEMVNARGYRAQTFSIMSGYRTPYYNRTIGNRTTYSRHLWGDAADIFIDEEPRDGKMDDLNQDGVIDTHDADVIYQLIENASEPHLQQILMGGLARYRETSSHGPFIHVDARGSYARWGLKTLTRGGSTSAETVYQVNDQSLSQPSFLDTQPTTEPTP